MRSADARCPLTFRCLLRVLPARMPSPARTLSWLPLHAHAAGIPPAAVALGASYFQVGCGGGWVGGWVSSQGEGALRSCLGGRRTQRALPTPSPGLLHTQLTPSAPATCHLPLRPSTPQRLLAGSEHLRDAALACGFFSWVSLPGDAPGAPPRQVRAAGLGRLHVRG